jgi:LmbE family N-acetylglucosaminyl deacetylase
MRDQPARPRYRAVFISPHLDDAVFSCGAMIDKLRQEGPVLVLNLFTRYLSDLKIHGAVLGTERYLEEINAARLLGFESLNLDELDAPFRRAPYRQLGNLFRHPTAADIAWLPSLRTRLLDSLAQFDYSQVFVPLGIGWHVDHILSYLAFEPWADQSKLLYYEDAPYCCIPHATRYRLADIATHAPTPGDSSLQPGHEIRAWRQAAQAYANTALMKNLQPWLVRQFAVPAVSFYLYRLMARHRLDAPTTRKRQLEPMIFQIDEHIDRKIAAMALYRSQFGEFFSSRQDCLNTLGTYSSSMGGTNTLVERYWVPKNVS